MDTTLLFRKRGPFEEEGLLWLRGNERNPRWRAKRNTTGAAGVSALLIRAIQIAVEGAIRAVTYQPTEPLAITVSSISRSSHKVIDSHLAAADTLWGVHLPNGAPDKPTYYIGVLAIAEAMLRPTEAKDFLDAFEELLAAISGGPARKE
jgi:hypothetical protein